MIEIQNQTAEIPPGETPGPATDAAARVRAVALALGRLDGATVPDVAALARGIPPRATLHEVASAVASLAHVAARVERMGFSDALATVHAGGAVMLARPQGWLVLHGGPGRRARATLVGRGGDQDVRAAPAFGPEPCEVLVFESSLPLEALSARSTGSRNPWARLRALISLERSELVALVVYAVVVGALSLAVPVAVQVLVNTIAFGSLLQPLVVLVILLTGVLVFAGTIQVVGWYAVEVLQRRVFVRVAEDFARRLLGAGTEVHDRKDVRELTNRFFEVVSLQKTLGRLLLDGLGLVLQTAVGMVLLGFYHPVLLAFDVGLLIALAAVISLGWGAVPSAIRESRAKYRVAAWLETLAARPTAFGGSRPAYVAATTADALTRDYLESRRAHYRRVLRQLIGGVGVQVITLVTLLGLGGWLVMEGELTLGQLVAAELVVGAIGVGFAKLGKHLESTYDLLASLDKVGQVVDLAPNPSLPSEAPALVWPMTLHGVRLARGDSPPGAPVTATVEAGSRLRLRGTSGSGKSVLLEALAGLRAWSEGRVAMAGVERADCRMLRSTGWLSRPDHAVDGTVFENLRLGDPDLTEAGAWELLRAVELDERVAGLEGGLGAAVLSHGGSLCRSDVARLCLARALASDAPLLLVDGTLDRNVLGLSPESHARLLDRVLGPDAPWAVVVVSDDTAVIARCEGEIDLDREPEGDAP